MGYDFIVPPHLPEGKDEYYLRDQQRNQALVFRKLTAYEIEVLVKNENQAYDWTDILVTNQFDPKLVKNCQFHGRIRIGALENYFLEYHELKLPVGLYNSTIVSCDIGDNVVIKNVNYLSHYQIGNEVILFNINEMHTTNHAKFGNGVVKEGEEEEVRIWLEICNENGGRKVLPFEGMIPADAWLWAKYRDDEMLMERLQEITETQFDSRRGYYGTVGDRTVIKNTRILKDVKVGTDAYIKGGNKLKNLTINSSEASPSQIGEGAEMVNGIMGYGSRAFYGIKAVRFIMGENTTLKYGARLINSWLGDNSTISCCEVLNSLIFPAHEQHHNNSFLAAATVMGQSNMAAGATIGSNHNSRGADGEILAGRGFWPALCVSLKHNSRFASFILIAKGDYPAELNVPFPFSLVSQDHSKNQLKIMPAYWWLYNMYALARNNWKYGARDNRQWGQQQIVFDFLAPDTVAEMFEARSTLEQCVATAYLATNQNGLDHPDTPAQLGKELLEKYPEKVDSLPILAEGIEASRRSVRLLKVVEAYQGYREMIHYYGIQSLIAWAEKRKETDLAKLVKELPTPITPTHSWTNMGGQLIRKEDVEALKTQIRDRSLGSWEAIHQRYREVHEQYTAHNAHFGWSALLALHSLTPSEVTAEIWKEWLSEAIRIKHLISTRTSESRKKDYETPSAP